MNQNRSAAGLRRSAVVERIRLREEWSALKGENRKSNQPNKPKLVAKKHTNNIKSNRKHKPITTQSSRSLRPINELQNVKNYALMTSEVLCGIVALVDVGAESRALALRAALTALGATVVPSWSPLVTHVIWSQGGSRATRAKARALACRLVSPLWVEGCAAAALRLPEQSFPAPTRPSDLPSPRTLRQLLKKADMENIPLTNIQLSDSKEEINPKQLRLRMSSETEQDTSADKTADTSCDKTADTPDTDTRVNTAPRRALPVSVSTSPQVSKKSRRKLFTYREAEVVRGSSEDCSDDETVTKPSRKQKPGSELKLTQRDRRDLARAERMAKKILASCTGKTTAAPCTVTANTPRIVLTGMNRVERHAALEAVRALGGRVQRRVNRRTTHIVLGSCQEAVTEGHQTADITGIRRHTSQPNLGVARTVPHKPRTMNALEGAVRGCRVLCAGWATESHLQGRWIYHAGYEVRHLKKISQKARVERAALGLQRSEYAYDVFNGIRVLLKENAEQRDAAKHLLTLCGAVLLGGEQQNGCLRSDVTIQHGRPNKHGGGSTDIDITIGTGIGEIGSKWVFDSVAAGRMRTTRRYVNCLLSANLERLSVR